MFTFVFIVNVSKIVSETLWLIIAYMTMGEYFEVMYKSFQRAQWVV
jgi:hypothetical protein